MTGRRIFLGLSVLWCLIILVLGYQSSPSIPLDMSAGDSATLAAYSSALWKHRILWGALAFIPVLGILLTNVFFKRS